MEKRYSEMTEYELKLEIGKLQEKARKAEQMGMINEFAVYERKIAMAKAYLLSPSQFQPGEVYEISGDPGSLFTIEYLKGVFAWGKRQGKEELEGIPISLLIKPEK
ncbi:YfhH family protein [Calidifontibacillus erzurumensis]|uniref:YfhH family protein n=1 Tax=Calidifontibacillus erzurumensis TaxID=2741433 RepID=A0A8J8KBN8_9BACI|nr:YfhH family protein [Calidifontibacillus erzurumensis]NSL52134.1 YfhH family protein [Calidifontibacillus erzurumensis]